MSEKSFMIADIGGAEYRVGLHSEAKGGKMGKEKRGKSAISVADKNNT